MSHSPVIDNERPNKTTYFLAMAKLVSTRGTCKRRRCGCVLVDRIGRVLATGYNGNGRGQNIVLNHHVKEQNIKVEKDLKSAKQSTQNKTLFYNVRILNLLRKLISL